MIGQAWVIIRRLRAHSPSTVGTIFSTARPPGTYTARRPCLTMWNGHAGSCPVRGPGERGPEGLSHAGPERRVVLRPDGVDRAVAGAHRRERRLVAPQPH